MADFLGSGDFDNLVGGIDDDSIGGNGGDDVLDGGGGDDQIHGDAGDDDISGDAGDDLVLGGTGDDTISGKDGNDVLSGERGADQLGGDNGNDAIEGGAGDDRLRGDEGDDVLEGGDGADVLSGDDGADILSGDRAPEGGAPPIGQLATDVFRWEAIDGTDDDRILDFFPGVDILQLTICSEFATLQALLATVGGNAVLSVARGGGIATLTLEGIAATALTVRDVDFVGAGQPDSLSGTAGADDLFGQRGNDTLSGAAGNDRLFGEQDSDTLEGGLGDDRLFGGSGDDILRGGAGADRLDGGAVTDLVSYFGTAAAVTVNLATGHGLGGEAQADSYAGIENVNGGKGADTLIGSAGANALNGFEGRDVLTGGGGADRFIFTAGSHSAVGANADRITDFSRAQGDKIDLSGIDASTVVAGNQAFSFIGTALYHHVAGELRFAVTGGTTTIAGDVNGDGASDFHIVLTGAVALTVADFVL